MTRKKTTKTVTPSKAPATKTDTNVIEKTEATTDVTTETATDEVIETTETVETTETATDEVIETTPPAVTVSTPAFSPADVARVTAPPISTVINVRAYAATMALNMPITTKQCAIQQEILMSTLVAVIKLDNAGEALAQVYEIMANNENSAFEARAISRGIGDTTWDAKGRAAFVLLTTTLWTIARSDGEVNLEWDALETALTEAGYDGESMTAVIQASAAK